MRKVTLWSSATSVDLRVSFGVDRRWPWADDGAGARVADTRRRRPNRSGCEIMKDPFQGDPMWGEAKSALKGHLTGRQGGKQGAGSVGLGSSELDYPGPCLGEPFCLHPE